MMGLIVHCDRHWEDNRFMGPISFACCLTNKEKDAYSELSETIFNRIGVKSDRFEIRISSELQTKNGKCTLSIMTDADVSCLLTYNQSDWHETNVEVVEKSVLTPSALKPTSNSKSSVSGSNQPFGSVPSPGITSTEKDHGTPASTNKYSEVDDSDSFETSDTEDESECSSDGYTSNDPNGVSEGQIFKDKQTLKGAFGLYALAERFELKVRRPNHTRKQLGKPKKQSGRP